MCPEWIRMNNKFKIQSSKFKVNKEKIIPLAIFIVLGFIALQLPINNLAGSGAKFTLFDLFAPTAGAFLGSWLGVIAVFSMQLANLAFHGFSNFDKGTIIRLFPILFGVLFFSKRSGSFLLIPFLAIILFNLNPVGRSVWYYSLFWTIPFFVYPVVKRSLVARSLASTFIAHSVGGAIWIWTFNLPAQVWTGLVPITALERSMMALGIAASYILMNNVLAFASKKVKVLKSAEFDKEYVKI